MQLSKLFAYSAALLATFVHAAPTPLDAEGLVQRPQSEAAILKARAEILRNGAHLSIGEIQNKAPSP
ncbi:hypothetical protein PsYK624_000740 [Phanerochaete sordida]|uniref:Uncharacterized protein n=1 Tax=Phanerochaete sordida TaxID=48140 RepID=A0A9P3FXD6_9APHY|nr:hypothetical protein PsYK624_000740 [Phanerochaete sordida]